ncbi:MAG: HAD family phosphatase [Clostridia bacterium]|nr:HAD family phosphatase [Clostridia bacterium]
MRLMLDEQVERMPWDALDAVVFDVGDVLLHYSPEAELEHFFPGDGEKQERLMRKIIRTPYWNMLDRGSLTPEEAIAAMTGRDRDLAGDIRTMLESFLSFNTVVEEGVRALRACRAQGKRTFALSNYQAWAFDRVERQYDFFALFEAKVVSAKVGMVKPNPDIYAYTAQTYGLNPSRTLLIDDTPANVEGAMHMGWQGLCFNEAGRLDRFLKEEV